MEKRKIVVFTGAGISAESGIKTFRDSGGLWDEYKVEEVAHIDGWKKDREKVLEFYNKRRAEMSSVEPNDAHRIIAEMEKDYQVVVITQNVDDLHEKAGSTNIIHLHGEMKKMRSSVDPSLVYPYDNDIKIGDKCEKGSQLRPNVVWFGENLDPMILESAANECQLADVLIIDGTSLQVQPAASLPFLTKQTCIIYYVDSNEFDYSCIPEMRLPFFYHHKEKATIGMKQVYDDIIDYLK